MTKLIAIQVRERGATPRNMKRVFNAAKKLAWHDTAVRFHAEYRDRRFTLEHAEEAGYARRKGELIARDSKAFRASYTGKKLRMFGHTRPLEFTGETRRKVRSASISSTSNMGKASYSGAAKFNFRHPRSKIRMGEEFRRITRREAQELGQFFDLALDRRLAEADAQG
jgi:hypothetical protein